MQIFVKLAVNLENLRDPHSYQKKLFACRPQNIPKVFTKKKTFQRNFKTLNIKIIYLESQRKKRFEKLISEFVFVCFSHLSASTFI